MLSVIRKVVGQMASNCYILIIDKTCLIIDPGDQADYILEDISRNNLVVKAILATHGHFDHVLATGEIFASFIDCEFYIHEADNFLLKRAKQTAKHFTGIDPITMPIPVFKALKEQNYKLGDFNFEVIFTPGHTPGGVCFYFKDDGIVFSGDTIFSDGVGRTDFAYSNREDLVSSIIKIQNLPQNTLVYPGHGEETRIAFLPKVEDIFNY